LYGARWSYAAQRLPRRSSLGQCPVRTPCTSNRTHACFFLRNPLTTSRQPCFPGPGSPLREARDDGGISRIRTRPRGTTWWSGVDLAHGRADLNEFRISRVWESDPGSPPSSKVSDETAGVSAPAGQRRALRMGFDRPASRAGNAPKNHRRSGLGASAGQINPQRRP